MLKFIVAISVASFCLVAFIYFGQSLEWFEIIPSYTWQIVAFLAFSTLVIFYYLSQSSFSEPQAFTQIYLLSIALKIVAYAIFILVIILQDKPGAVGNALLFIAAYLLFTLIEVVFLFNKMNS